MRMRSGSQFRQGDGSAATKNKTHTGEVSGGKRFLSRRESKTQITPPKKKKFAYNPQRVIGFGSVVGLSVTNGKLKTVGILLGRIASQGGKGLFNQSRGL